MNFTQLIEDMSIHIDESGDPGLRFQPGFNRYLVVAAIVIHNEQNRQQIIQTIQKFRKRHKFSDDYEIKFTKLGKWRSDFLTQIASSPFTVWAILIDKAKPRVINPVTSDYISHTIYDYMRQLLVNSLSGIQAARIAIDGQIDNRCHKGRVRACLRRSLNLDKKNRAVRDINFVLIQKIVISCN